MLRPAFVLCALLSPSMTTGLLVAGSQDASQIRYNRDVRPILADNCFRCHGPDAAARQADLRLDRNRDAIADRGGRRVIEPGNPAASELVRRITSTSADERMPPPDSDSTLSAKEIRILSEWIKAGAEYEPHWSFIPPSRPSLPIVNDDGWSRNAIDRFILSRLEQDTLRPSPEADPATLIRRVSLDLTGLPPSPGELNAYERDVRHDPDAAYRNLVDRLLASPRYGERMALDWLDAARYADTNGYFTDNDRTMWPWRDWVIGAFNANMPFDRFTIEQLAGDLLPNATIDQKIATGFNRNHMVNNETGIVEEEFRVEYVVDRVDTTATVWMGLTLGCARCHDHKYDPVSQQDFYRFFAFFNNVPERGLSGSGGNSAPLLTVTSAAQQRQLDRVQRDVLDAERQFAAVKKQIDESQAAWETNAVAQLPDPPAKGLVSHDALDTEPASSSLVGSVDVVSGMVGKAAKFNGDSCIEIHDVADFDRHDAFSLGAWIHPQGAGCVLSKMDDANEMRGFDVTLRKGKAIVNLVHRWNRNAIRVSTAASVPSRQWLHLMVAYDGSGTASGVSIFVDGKPQPVEITLDNLSGTMRNQEPLRIGRRQASASYNGLIDEVRIYDRRLSDEEADQLASSQLVRGIVSQPPGKRSAAQTRKLRAWFLEHLADSRLATLSTRLDQLRETQNRLRRSLPTTMVMQESEKPRQAFLLVRGQYDQQGEVVTSGVPAFLNRHEGLQGNSSPARPSSSNRLDLANWLVTSSHPLTARVTVNRLWQQMFGAGIVKSVDDFGTQGDWPSHPELLDWLALELIDSGWDVKHIMRLIATSAAYRQSSDCPPTLLARDRDNRLLARASRIRMAAETLRDNALAISGLLADRLGGPSVNPYQPDGLWKDVTYDSDRAYGQDGGDALYRRSLYTFWKRQSPPPNMLVFDAPTRETCVVQRSRTNTPLQALVLMNDPTFVEASRKLAERMMTEVRRDSKACINFAFRAATARRPTVEEVDILLAVFHQQKQAFAASSNDAAELLSVGESEYDASLDPAELAAWTTVASMILSLDETITRP